MLNLDTHILLFALTDDLKPRERTLLSAVPWSISAIVLWEIAKLGQLGRITIDLQDPEVVRALSRIHIWPLTREIAQASTELDIEGDPADELIGATSVIHNVPLLTRDKVLLKSRQIPLAHPAPKK